MIQTFQSADSEPFMRFESKTRKIPIHKILTTITKHLDSLRRKYKHKSAGRTHTALFVGIWKQCRKGNGGRDGGR